MKVRDVLEMCEKLALQGRIGGVTLDNWRPMGQYSLVKDLLHKAYFN